MPLTARNPDTGAIIYPFDDGARSAVCRDPECASTMHAVSAVFDGEVMRRTKYWAHTVHNETCPTRRDSSMTPWHANWQMTCTDRERVEVVVQRGEKVRRADIMTKWSYAIEVQHSAISKGNVHGRENHYNGKVMWLYDGTLDGQTGGVDKYDGKLRWSSFPSSIEHTRTLVAVDDGEMVRFLPTGPLMVFAKALDLLIPLEKTRQISHQQFVDEWINGDVMPVRIKKTQWQIDRENSVKLARGKSPEESERAAYERELRDLRWDQCEFSGDRSKLIGPPRDEDELSLVGTASPGGETEQTSTIDKSLRTPIPRKENDITTGPTRGRDPWGWPIWIPLNTSGIHGCAGPACLVVGCWGYTRWRQVA